MIKTCCKCKKEEEMEEGQLLCELCSLKYKFELYQREVSSILLKHYCDKDKETGEKIKKMIEEGDSYFYLTDKVLQYVGEKGIHTSALDILQYLKETKNKHEKEKDNGRKLIY